MQPFQLHRFVRPKRPKCPRSTKRGEPELSVLRDVKEAAAVQQYWHLAERPKARKPPKDYKYVEELAHLQFELIKLQEWVRLNGLKVVVLFEGRDAAGKGGAIKRITESLNPRICRVVALGTPTERERGQWYFQRYVAQLPAKGEIVLFDRSWYNRAGVERVMGFCTDEEYQEFLRACPLFEEMLVRSGIILIKYWFSVNDEEQERRFQERIAQSDQALEAQPDGPRVAQALGRLLQGQGRDVRAHRPQEDAVVRRQRRQQEAGPAQLHRPPAGSGPLSGHEAGRDRGSAAPVRYRLQAPQDVVPEICSRDLLSSQQSALCQKRT